MLYQAVFAAVVCIAIFEIIYWVKFTLKTPVPGGSKIYCVVSYHGDDSALLQRTVESIVYLKSVGILDSTVVIDAASLKGETLKCAQLLARRSENIRLEDEVHI
jgi:hypothetical protein